MNEKADNNYEPDGVLIINKHKDATSHDIVNMVRKLYNTKKVGHTGTLDPMATGVLVVLVGRAAKACEYLVSDSKKYEAGLKLGLTTDTEDTSGKILSESDLLPSREDVFKVIPEFTGRIMQIPPMYSALKVNGRKLVDIARSGKTVDREAREITIYSLGCTPTESASDYKLSVHCSGGTYIRTLCADIGNRLSCGGVMSSLCRTQTGNFDISQSVTIEELKEMDIEERFKLLIPTESLFADLEKVILPEFYFGLCRNGCEIYEEKIGVSFEIGKKVRLCSPDGEFFALGEVREYENGSAIKPVKFFVLK